nr:hypothetical protein [uncultured Roseococcus sp.]
MVLPISSVSILACRDTLAAGLLTRLAGAAPVEPGAAESMLDRQDLPVGISAREWTALPRMVTPIEAEHMPHLHAEALSRAWRCGAWDLQVTLHPPLLGPELGLVVANTDWEDCEPGLLEALIRAAESGRLATWLWRPMLGGPALRRQAHQDRDASLRPDGSRDGVPREVVTPNWAWEGGRSWTLRLGIPSAGVEADASAPRATGRQRAYIVALRRELGRSGEPLPAKLTRPEASRIITELQEQAGQHDTYP